MCLLWLDVKRKGVRVFIGLAMKCENLARSFHWSRRIAARLWFVVPARSPSQRFLCADAADRRAPTSVRTERFRPARQMSMLSALALLLCTPAADALSSFSASRPAVHVRMSATDVVTDVKIEDAIAIFGRLSDSQHVFEEPIRTAASGFEFSSNTAIKPKWLIGYDSREPCGEDVDLPTHTTVWASLLYPDGSKVCTRENFDSVICSATYTAPLGTPKWAVAGKVLVDTKACAAPPSAAALDALWSALDGGDELALESVIAKFRGWAASDDLNEAVLFSEFWGVMQSSASPSAGA